MSKLTLATAALFAASSLGWASSLANAQGQGKPAANKPPAAAPLPPLIPPMGYSGYGAYSPYFPFGYMRYSSTAGEGYQRGYADVLRSAGMNHLYNAEALKELEAARREEIANRKKGVDAYFEVKRANAEYRALMRGTPPTGDDAARYAKQRAPKHLNYVQLDPVSGELNWPALLRDKKLAEDRQTIDDAFIQQAQAGDQALSDKKYKALNQSVQRLMQTLKDEVHQTPPGDYVKAREFLDSLAREARNMSH